MTFREWLDYQPPAPHWQSIISPVANAIGSGLSQGFNHASDKIGLQPNNSFGNQFASLQRPSDSFMNRLNHEDKIKLSGLGEDTPIDLGRYVLIKIKVGNFSGHKNTAINHAVQNPKIQGAIKDHRLDVDKIKAFPISTPPGEIIYAVKIGAMSTYHY